MARRKAQGGLDDALLETATALHRAGVVRAETLQRISRRVDPKSEPALRPLSAIEIRHLREAEGLTKADFAVHLNLSIAQIDRLERGVTKPTGATAKLLDIVKRRGLSAIR